MYRPPRFLRTLRVSLRTLLRELEVDRVLEIVREIRGRLDLVEGRLRFEFKDRYSEIRKDLLPDLAIDNRLHLVEDFLHAHGRVGQSHVATFYENLNAVELSPRNESLAKSL